MKSDIAAAVLIEKIVRDTYGSLRSSEIQPLQWSILRFLKQSNGRGSNLSAITDHLGVTLSPVSRAVQTLVKRGLVRKAPNPRNAREVIVTLTGDGRDALTMDPILEIARRLHSLPEAQRSQFIATLQVLATTRPARSGPYRRGRGTGAARLTAPARAMGNGIKTH